MPGFGSLTRRVPYSTRKYDLNCCDCGKKQVLKLADSNGRKVTHVRARRLAKQYGWAQSKLYGWRCEMCEIKRLVNGLR